LDFPCGQSGVQLHRRQITGFKWPPITDGVMRLSGGQLAALLDGLDWTRLHLPRIARPKVTQ
jgi:transposase